jgi:hypothetical protein
MYTVYENLIIPLMGSLFTQRSTNQLHKLSVVYENLGMHLT